jgi:ribose/xylose/arabinose/galactoside ABC-type transport system permease subunit
LVDEPNHLFPSQDRIRRCRAPHATYADHGGGRIGDPSAYDAHPCRAPDLRLWGNPEAAARIGIKILPLQLRVYGYLGFLAGVAGFVQAHRVHQAVPTAMFGTELNVVAVAILGGASLVGAVGSMGGVILGVLLLAILQNGLNLLGVSYFFGVVVGLTILVSISVTGHAEKGVRPRRRREVS